MWNEVEVLDESLTNAFSPSFLEILIHLSFGIIADLLGLRGQQKENISCVFIECVPTSAHSNLYSHQ